MGPVGHSERFRHLAVQYGREDNRTQIADGRGNVDN